MTAGAICAQLANDVGWLNGRGAPRRVNIDTINIRSIPTISPHKLETPQLHGTAGIDTRLISEDSAETFKRNQEADDRAYSDTSGTMNNNQTSQLQSMATSGGAVKQRQLVCYPVLIFEFDSFTSLHIANG